MFKKLVSALAVSSLLVFTPTPAHAASSPEEKTCRSELAKQNISIPAKTTPKRIITDTVYLANLTSGTLTHRTLIYKTDQVYFCEIFTLTGEKINDYLYSELSYNITNTIKGELSGGETFTLISPSSASYTQEALIKILTGSTRLFLSAGPKQTENTLSASEASSLNHPEWEGKTYTSTRMPFSYTGSFTGQGSEKTVEVSAKTKMKAAKKYNKASKKLEKTYSKKLAEIKALASEKHFTPAKKAAKIAKLKKHYKNEAKILKKSYLKKIRAKKVRETWTEAFTS